MKVEKTKIAILIPNYNGALFIKNTIENILVGFDDMIIVVVDDSSTDNSVEVINGLHIDNIKLIVRENNGGFASAVNTGIQYCIENQFDFVIVSNSDIVLTKSISEDIHNELSSFEDLNVAVLGFLEAGVHIARYNENISGFFFILRLSIISNVGYFDESFFMYGEEQDYFRKVIKNKYKIIQTNVEIPHLSEQSTSSNLRNSWLSIRNSIYLEAKSKKIIPVLRKIIVLFILINKIYKPKVVDPSLIRLYRPGVIKGNYYLFLAIGWNILKSIGVIKNAK